MVGGYAGHSINLSHRRMGFGDRIELCRFCRDRITWPSGEVCPGGGQRGQEGAKGVRGGQRGLDDQHEDEQAPNAESGPVSPG